MTLGEKLKYARKACGLTQTKAALKSGIAQPDISAYELGRREPKWSQLVKLADAYFKNASWFLDGKEPTKETVFWCKT